MVNDYNNHNELDFPKYFDRENDTFETYLKKLIDLKISKNLKPGLSSTITYWLINQNDEILGTIRFREKLNEYTLNDGGNIGYDICPSFRNKGYGNLILKLLIEKLKKKSIYKKLLITCEVDNLFSNLIVKNNGGILENKVISKRTGKDINRYWLEITAPNTVDN